MYDWISVSVFCFVSQLESCDYFFVRVNPILSLFLESRRIILFKFKKHIRMVINMADIKEMTHQGLEKIKEQAGKSAEEIKVVAEEKKEILEAEASIHKDKLKAEAEHLLDVQKMKKEVQKEAKEFKNMNK